MSRANDYLASFNGIEKYLRRLVHADAQMRFYGLVERAAEVSPVVRQFASDLKEFADLRNAIVHGPRDAPIADPYAETVGEIAEVARLIREPPLLVTRLEVGSVVSCSVDDRLADVIATMRDKRFSQIPAYKGPHFIALLTAETVMRWLAARGAARGATTAAVKAVLPHAENTDNVVLVPLTTDVFDALRRFEDYQLSGRSLDAIIVTEDGRDAPLAIATVFDIPNFAREVYLSGRRDDATRSDPASIGKTRS